MQVATAEGRWVRALGCFGPETGQLICPRALSACPAAGTLFVTDADNTRVQALLMLVGQPGERDQPAYGWRHIRGAGVAPPRRRRLPPSDPRSRGPVGGGGLEEDEGEILWGGGHAAAL